MDGGDKFLRDSQPTNPMASAMGDDLSLRDLTHPALNDCLKSHNAATFKLVKTGTEKTVLIIDYRVLIHVDIVNSTIFFPYSRLKCHKNMNLLYQVINYVYVYYWGFIGARKHFFFRVLMDGIS